MTVLSDEAVQAKRVARMAAIDAYPPEIRALIKQYGLTSVRAIMDCGVSKAAQIQHIIETVLDEFSPTRGSNSFQGPHRARGAR